MAKIASLIPAISVLLVICLKTASAIDGWGCTTATYIDNDCDGYGPGTSAGPDANDDDPTVNTPASFQTMYSGNLKEYFGDLGYNVPGDIFFISPSGNDNTGMKNDISKPFGTFYPGIKSQMKPGDAVVFRAGTYATQVNVENMAGTSFNYPLLFIAYPGEKPIIDGTGFASGFTFGYTEYAIFHGFYLRSNGLGYCLYGYNNHYWIVKNIECYNWYSGFWTFQDLKFVTYEGNLVHDSMQAHCYYLGAREQANADVTFRNNLAYRCEGHCIQHNGMVQRLKLDRNILSTSALGGISILNGATDSVISNNLVFGYSRAGITFYVYTPSYWPAQPQERNLVINNIFYTPSKNFKGTAVDHFGIHFTDDATGGLCNLCLPPYTNTVIGTVTMNDNVIRNNIFFTQTNAVVAVNPPGNTPTQTVDITKQYFENNLMFKADGQFRAMWIAGTEYTWTQFQSFSTRFKNNVWGDAKFVAASPTQFYNSPNSFNFLLQSTSPAINMGSATSAPAIDILGAVRTGTIDAGCYEYGAVVPSSSSSGAGSTSSGSSYATSSSSGAASTSSSRLSSSGYGVASSSSSAGGSTTMMSSTTACPYTGITAKVTVSVPGNPSTYDIAGFVSAIHNVLGIPSTAISSVVVLLDQSSETTVVIEFVIVEVMCINPVAKAVLLKAYAASNDPILARWNLANLAFIDNGSTTGDMLSSAVSLQFSFVAALLMQLFFAF